MESFLKTSKHKSKLLGRTFELLALSAADQADIVDARADGANTTQVAALTAQRGVIEWRDEAAEDVARNMSLDALLEVASAVVKLSELDALGDPKNSEADRAAA